MTSRRVKWLESGRATLTLPQGGVYIASISQTIKSASFVYYSGDFQEIDASRAFQGDFETRLKAAPIGHLAIADRNGQLMFEIDYVFSDNEKRESLYRTALAKVDEKLMDLTACAKAVDDPSIEFNVPIP